MAHISPPEIFQTIASAMAKVTFEQLDNFEDPIAPELAFERGFFGCYRLRASAPSERTRLGITCTGFSMTLPRNRIMHFQDTTGRHQHAFFGPGGTHILEFAMVDQKSHPLREGREIGILTSYWSTI